MKKLIFILIFMSTGFFQTECFESQYLSVGDVIRSVKKDPQEIEFILKGENPKTLKLINKLQKLLGIYQKLYIFDPKTNQFKLFCSETDLTTEQIKKLIAEDKLLRNQIRKFKFFKSKSKIDIRSIYNTQK